jgi:adenosine deaminase
VRDLTTLPKAHLHVHLEGAIRPETVAALAGQHHGLDPSPYTDPADFFRRTALVRDCLRRPEDFYRAAVEFCEDELAGGSRWVEVMFTAAAHGARLGDRDGPLRAVLDGLSAVPGLECRVILDHSRRRPVEWAWTTLELALRHADRGVVAIGLAGDEAFPAAPFAEVFAAARAEGVPVVHHAGEFAGPASIREALDQGSVRLGHGIRALEDPSLVARLRDEGIPLEVCPTSNVALTVVPSFAAHPLPRLVEEGLVVTLNADTPAMLDTSLVGEFSGVRRVFGYPDEQLAGLARAGVAASFAPAATKAALQREIDAWLAAP